MIMEGYTQKWIAHFLQDLKILQHRFLFKPWIFRQYKLFHDESPYQIETRPLICYANQWTGFYIIGTSVRNS